MSEKLQKILAAAGLGSRREIEKWIAEGRISVNGKVATLGDRATAEDRIAVDGRPLRDTRPDTPRVLVYHKPEGEICTVSDPEGRPTVFDALPRLARGRWIAVGRLDINTSGLLLFTTDGELANRLMHPSYEVTREYLARIHGEVDDAMLQRLTEGVLLDDGVAKFSQVRPQRERSDTDSGGRNRWFHVILSEGRTREVRRLWESQGVEVSRLKRIRFGPVELPSYVRKSQFVDLEPKALESLYKAVDLNPPPLTEKKIYRDIRVRKEKKLRARGDTRR